MTLLFDVRALNPAATAAQIGDAIALAVATNARAVCVLPTMLQVAAGLHSQLLAQTGEAVPISSVAGWPTGAHHTLVKASEARLAVDQGAQEVAVVMAPNLVVAGEANALLSEAVTVRQAVPQPVSLTLGFDVSGIEDAQVAAAVSACLPAAPDGVTLLHSNGGEVRAQTCSAVKAVLPAEIGVRVDDVKSPQAAQELAAAGVGVAVISDPSCLSEP